MTAIKVEIGTPEQIEQHSYDQGIVDKVLAQIPVLAEMETIVAFEDGDFDAAGRSLSSARAAYQRAEQLYIDSGVMEDIAAGEAKLGELESGTNARTFTTRDLKRRYGASRRTSRGRPPEPDPDAE